MRRRMKDSPSHADSNADLDPVIEAYKKDVDVTLIRENLRLTVDQRFQQLMKMQRFAEELQQAGQKARPQQPSPEDTGLPPEICDRSAWYGAELAGRSDWIETLCDAEIAEAESAVRELGKSQVDLASIDVTDVPLPTLGPRLQQLLEEVLNGRGFVLIRALPVECWTRREAAIAFLAIGVHLGRLLMQNADGHLLGH